MAELKKIKIFFVMKTSLKFTLLQLKVNQVISLVMHARMAENTSKINLKVIQMLLTMSPSIHKDWKDVVTRALENGLNGGIDKYFVKKISPKAANMYRWFWNS